MPRSRPPGSEDRTGRVEVWVDALGELASVGGTETWWDTAAVVPTLISVDDTPLLGLPGGVTAIGDDWTTPGWRSARATDPTDPTDPWTVLGQVAGLDLPTGVHGRATLTPTPATSPSTPSTRWACAPRPTPTSTPTPTPTPTRAPPPPPASGGATTGSTSPPES